MTDKVVLFETELTELKKLSSIVNEQTTDVVPGINTAAGQEAERARQAARFADFRQRNPGLSTAAELAVGAAVPGGAIAKGGSKLFNWLKGGDAATKAATAAARIEPRMDLKPVLPKTKVERLPGETPADATKRTQDQLKGTTTANNPVQTAPPPAASTAPAPPGTGKPGNIEISVPSRTSGSPGGAVGTDITGAASRSVKPPTIAQSLDKQIGLPNVTPSAPARVTPASTGSGPASARPPSREAQAYLKNKGEQDKWVADVKPNAAAKTTASTSDNLSNTKAIAAGLGLGAGALGAAYLAPDEQTNKPAPSSNVAQPANSASNIVLPSASADNNKQIDVANAQAWANANPATRRDIENTTGTSADKFRSMAGANSAAQPSYMVKAGDTLGHIAQQYNTTVSDLIKNKPDLVDTETGKLKPIMPGQTINVGQSAGKDVNVWKDYDVEKLGTGSGKEFKESVNELKKLSGMIK